jgi:hypothetical protein
MDQRSGRWTARFSEYGMPKEVAVKTSSRNGGFDGAFKKALEIQTIQNLRNFKFVPDKTRIRGGRHVLGTART